jgi:hypothetical protein
MKNAIIFCLFINLAAVGLSQTEKLLVPSDLKQQTIVTEPVTLRKGFFRAGLLLDYRVADRFISNSGRKEYYESSSWGSKSAYGITLQYGISDRLQIDIVSEYLNKSQEIQNTVIDAVTNTSTVTVSKQKGLGLGDSHVALKYQVIQEIERNFSLSGQLRITVPTGEKNPGNIKSENQYDLPVGDGTFAMSVNLAVRKIAYPYSFSGYAAYTYNFNGTKIFNTFTLIERRFRYGNLFETGLCGNFHLNEWIVFGNEISFYSEGQGKIENIATELLPASLALSYEPGLIFQVHRFRLGETVRIPITGRNVPADPLYILTAQYVF